MELHRSRAPLVGGVIFVSFGVFLLLCSSAPAIIAWLFGGLAVLVGGLLVVGDFMPFRCLIWAEGLTLQAAGLNRLVPWAEIDAIILDEPIPSDARKTTISRSLLLIPAAGSTIDQPLTAKSPVDGRAALFLFDLDDVQQPVDKVAAVLARFGGGRFIDVRQLRRERFDSPEFTLVPRGYDPTQVDELIWKGRDALVSNLTLRRYAAKIELEEARAALPLATRGYDPGQVDALLEELSAVLARWAEDTKPE
ncbi:hypothetical protein ACGFIR_06470 [Micromonospora sp. NPDC049051]|uniref:hypothetical protein n=1 Tax=Micromonospora sp. NPDC049051 TaxID=3364264 RepID=UPI00370FCE4B